MDLVKPYPNKASIDVTAEMKKQGWTVNTMFKKAEDFFVSMGLDPMMEVKKILHDGTYMSGNGMRNVLNKFKT